MSAVGRSFTFDVAVAGTAPFTYQWFHDGNPLTDATNRTLRLTRITAAQLGNYAVEVSNAEGSVVSSNATLSLITQHPRGGMAARGEDFEFDVQAAGTGPFRFQWRRDGVAIRGATNDVLIRTNVSRSARYTVRVSNPHGSIVSSNANLTITRNPRRISFFAPPSATPACVETRLIGNGFENAVAFSLSYNTNLFANPVFQPDRADATVQQQTSNGLVGAVVQLPPGARFARGDQLLGFWCFDVISASNVLHAQLIATDQPVGITATNTTGEPLVLIADVEPRIIVLDSSPTLNLQSGLFEQRIEVGNPAAVRRRLQIAAIDFGRDSRDNEILLHNRHGTIRIDTDFDGVVDRTVPRVQKALDPGEAAVFTLEFYVPDLTTVPAPEYMAVSGTPLRLRPPNDPNVLSIRAVRVLGGDLVVEFPTRSSKFRYYIQYADTISQLNNPARVRTAFPPIRGTGSTVQWIDNGPPKTVSPPGSAGSRFYRVLEVRAR